MTVFIVENWPSFWTYMNTLNSVILEMQSHVVFNNRHAMCVKVKASFLSRFLQPEIRNDDHKTLKRYSNIEKQ